MDVVPPLLSLLEAFVNYFFYPAILPPGKMAVSFQPSFPPRGKRPSGDAMRSKPEADFPMILLSMEQGNKLDYNRGTRKEMKNKVRKPRLIIQGMSPK
jgi:hypothetical protein